MSLRSNPTSKSRRIKVGITLGDPCGIGPAIVLKALRKLKEAKVDFKVFGSSFVLKKYAHLLGFKSIPGKELLDLDNVDKQAFVPGRISAASANASIEYLDRSLEFLKTGQIDCLVTCPISKEAINLAGFRFSGHTEYLACKTGVKNVLMVLLNNKLKFSLITRHIALKDVSDALVKADWQSHILSTAKCLKSLFLVRNPKIVICGLNPHASDNGLLGGEENEIMVPAIKHLMLKNKELRITGPLSADVAVSLALENKFDCVVAAYHDQALIALKISGRQSGVNLTYGLPFVRTSPLHGTAFDIAKKPHLANPASLISAIKIAIQCTLNLKKS